LKQVFSTREVAAYFNRTEQTIRAWANEYQVFLTVNANPGDGKNRSYSVEDMTVFALVSEMKKQRQADETIHASLRSGSRGEAPQISERDLKVLTATEGEKRAAIEISALRNHVIDLQERLAAAEARAAQVEQTNIEKAKLETELGIRNTDLEAARQELKQAQQRIEELNRQLGREYAQGFKDGLREQGRGEIKE
jgi:predicted RNase H-like nuclease (RuvC/YqgF family)